MSEEIKLPDAPAIDGLRFRHFRGDSDYPGILDVNTGSKLADGLEHDVMSLDVIMNIYSHTSNHDPYKDMLIAEVGDKMVAFNRIAWETEPDGTRQYFHYGFVLPEWRGKGIGRALLHHVERRAREIDAARTGGPGAALNADTHGQQAGLENLLLSEGYEPVRYGYHMERDLVDIPDYPLPEGLEVRPVTPEHMRAIYDAEVEAFRDHWGFTEPEEATYEAWISHPLNQPELWQVAWDGDQVVGMVRNYVNEEYNTRSGRKLGYTEDISVRRPWRKRGVARALISRSMKIHKDTGMTEVALSVDTQNPNGALQLYESMGYKTTSHETAYRKWL
jgi:GNAT superfamily N-acetyltransferase